MQKLVTRFGLWPWMLVVGLFFTFSCEEEYNPYDPYANFDHAAQAALEEDIIKNYLTTNNITDFTRTASGLYYVKVEAGSGDKPVPGNRVEVKYIGRTIQGGYKFDSSYDRGTTFPFILGQKQVIPGWDEGVAMMQRNEKALLLIPSRLAYGLTGSRDGSIRPNTPIMFEVHLIGF